jgi:hypothetical protein
MKHSELNRVQDDLATLRQSIGLDPSFNRSEIVLNFAAGLGGLFAIGWGLFAKGLPEIIGIVPTVLLALVWLARQHHDPIQIKPREWMAYGIAIAGAFIYKMWARAQQISWHQSLGTALFVIGIVFSIWAVMEPRRRYYLVFGIPTAVVGLLMPISSIPWIVLFGGAIAVSGPAMGVWQLAILRQRGRLHVAD